MTTDINCAIQRYSAIINGTPHKYYRYFLAANDKGIHGHFGGMTPARSCRDRLHGTMRSAGYRQIKKDLVLFYGNLHINLSRQKIIAKLCNKLCSIYNQKHRPKLKNKDAVLVLTHPEVQKNAVQIYKIDLTIMPTHFMSLITGLMRSATKDIIFATTRKRKLKTIVKEIEKYSSGSDARRAGTLLRNPAIDSSPEKVRRVAVSTRHFYGSVSMCDIIRHFSSF